MVDSERNWIDDVIFDAGAKQGVDENTLYIFLGVEFFKVVFGMDFNDVDVFADLFVMVFCGVGEFFFVAEEENNNRVFFGEVFSGSETVAAVVALPCKNDDVFVFGMVFLLDCEMYLFAGIFH